MTHLLEKAIERLSALPQQKQDSVARFILDRLDMEDIGEAKGPFRALIMSMEYRKCLKQIGVWTEEDVQPIKDAEFLWQWQAPEWS